MPNSNWRTDNQLLIEEFNNGNRDVFHYLYNLNNHSLAQYCYQLTGSTEEAEDIVSEAFLRIWERRQTFQTVDDIKPYLFTIARNLCFDYLKHSKRKDSTHKEILAKADTGEDYIHAKYIEAELLSRVLKETKIMPDGMKEVFHSLYVEGLSIEETSQKLNISVETVRTQKSKGLKLLKKAFENKNLVTTGVISTASLEVLKLILHL